VAMLERLAEKPELVNRVETICQDILVMPFDRSVDVVISAMAMHHVEDADLLLSRFYQQLNPGGQIALADLDLEDGTFHPEDVQGVFHPGFDRQTLQDKLERIGFADVRFDTAVEIVKEQGSYPIFLMTARKA